MAQLLSGVYGDYHTSEAISVVAASALVISGTDSDLGTLTAPVGYSVSSDTGNTITVTEEVNGVILRTYTATSGQQQSIAIPDLPTGSGSITIKASVQASSGTVSQTRSWTYTKTAPTFPSGPFDISTLSKSGKTQFPLTLAEAVKMPLGLGMVGVQSHIANVYTGEDLNPTTISAATANAFGAGVCCTEKPVWDDDANCYKPSGTQYSFSVGGGTSGGCWAAYCFTSDCHYAILNDNPQVFYYSPGSVKSGGVYEFNDFNGTQTVCQKYTPVFGQKVVFDPTIRDLLGSPVGVQIATGSYVGTGTWGQSNQNTLTFDFKPSLVIIAPSSTDYQAQTSGIYIWGNAIMPTIGSSDGVNNIVNVDGNTMTWYAAHDFNAGQGQFNIKCTYYYIALGIGRGGGVTEPPEEAPINFAGGMGVGGVPIVIDKSKILITPVNDRYTVTIQKSALYMQQATNNAYYSLLHTITGGGINTADGSSITTSQQFLNGYSQSSYQIHVYPNAGETPTITISATD